METILGLKNIRYEIEMLQNSKIALYWLIQVQNKVYEKFEYVKNRQIKNIEVFMF